MRKPVLSILACLAACLALHGQVILNTGDVYTYEFNSLPFAGQVSDPLTPMGFCLAILNPATVQAGDAIRLELFENSLAELPSADRSWTNSSMTTCSAPMSWGDLQGAIRVTMLSGTATLDWITLRSFTATGGTPPLNLWERSFTPVPVPEPGIMALVGMALLIGLGSRRWMNRGCR